MEDLNIVRYDGVCPICGSQDGMVVKGKDGKYRNICRVMGCKAMYKPSPFSGYGKPEDAANPWDSDLMRNGITIGEYLTGEREEDNA